MGLPALRESKGPGGLAGKSAASEEEAAEAARKNKVKCELMNWHCANLEFANACLVENLSMKSWDQDDPYELPGAHCFIPGGCPAAHGSVHACPCVLLWGVLLRGL